jgi:hypothetical protein
MNKYNYAKEEKKLFKYELVIMYIINKINEHVRK